MPKGSGNKGERLSESDGRAPAEQLWEAKQGRAKGNEQRTEYAELDEADGKPAVDEGEKRRGRKEPSLDEEPTVRRSGQRAERKKQRAE